MRIRSTILVLAILGCHEAATMPASTVAQRAPAHALAPQLPTAFIDVTVVPMDVERELPHQTVVTREGRIVAFGPTATTAVPDDAKRIERNGSGFLIPGLADMHVHTFVDDELVLDIANGVTTVRNLHGVPGHLAWRDSIARGLKFGPRFYTSGPIVDGSPPARSTNQVIRTLAEADAVVAAQKDSGYDFLKVYDALSRPLYEELAAAAARSGIRMVGHIPTAVGLDGLLQVNGQFGIEHAEMFLPMQSDPARLTAQLTQLAQRGIWVDPTLDVFANYSRQMTDWSAMVNRPEMRYVSPSTTKTWGWYDNNPNRNGGGGRLIYINNGRDFFLNTLVRGFVTAGVRLVAGTDAPLPMIVPGFALHDELELLVQAGLTPYAALGSATRNAADMIGNGANFGIIGVGRDSDLVLLDADPLANIANTRRIAGVLAQGRWYSSDDLKARLELLARAYSK